MNHAAGTWLPVLVDLGYQGADLGYLHAIHKPKLDRSMKAQNRFLTVLRCICERGNALLKARWRRRALRRVEAAVQDRFIGRLIGASPGRIRVHLGQSTSG